MTYLIIFYLFATYTFVAGLIISDLKTRKEKIDKIDIIGIILSPIIFFFILGIAVNESSKNECHEKV